MRNCSLSSKHEYSNSQFFCESDSDHRESVGSGQYIESVGSGRVIPVIVMLK